MARRKSIKWHKEKLLARLSALAAKNHIISVWIEQIATVNIHGDRRNCVVAWLVYNAISIASGEKYVKCYPLIKPKRGVISITFLNNRVLRAAHQLIIDKQLVPTMAEKEWQSQIALGTATSRKLLYKALQ